MRTAFGEGLLKASSVLFLLAYVYAAAAYGLTRESTLVVFQWGMGGIFFLWLVAHAFLGRLPRTGLTPWIFVGLILIYGWSVTLVGAVQEALLDDRLPGWDEWFPSVLLDNWSSYDSTLSTAAMVRTSVLLGAMLMAIDLWRRPQWARALLVTLIFSSFAMVVFFLLQRLYGGPFLLDSLNAKTSLSFATYRYWGNAASYLNLFWPIVVACASYAAIRQSTGWPFWLVPAAALFAANFLNVSKAGNALAALGTVLLAALIIPIGLRAWKRANRRIRASHLLVALIPLLVIAGSIPFALPWNRWGHLMNTVDQEETGGRPHAYATFLKILPDSGWVGFGPGTFQQQYLRYVQNDPQLKFQSYWVAHEDYIQTAVEWGYLGTILWALLLVPPIAAVGRASLRPPAPSERDFGDYRITLWDHMREFLATLPGPRESCFAAGVTVSLVLTALHSLVDFPMQIASLQLYFLVLVALGWSYLTSNEGVRPKTSPTH